MADQLTRLTDRAVEAIMAQLLDELRAGHITVVEHALKNETALVISVAFAASGPRAVVSDPQQAPKESCPSCGGSEVTTAGGMDRLCIGCQHVWRPTPFGG